MSFKLKPLPYSKDALAPHIGAETLEIHHGKHHQGYIDKLNEAVEGTGDADKSLDTLIETARGDLFNNAAQSWNHAFYWQSLSPQGGGGPKGALLARVKQDFGDVEALKKALAEAATGQFGSGWAWLTLTAEGKLEVESTADADNPLRHRKRPLLTIDVWEHAYYLDHRNERGRYVEAVLEHLLDWQFAQTNYER